LTNVRYIIFIGHLYLSLLYFPLANSPAPEDCHG
jgi:hypothetical protein